jgi:hypothetical protein
MSAIPGGTHELQRLVHNLAFRFDVLCWRRDELVDGRPHGRADRGRGITYSVLRPEHSMNPESGAMTDMSAPPVVTPVARIATYVRERIRVSRRAAGRSGAYLIAGALAVAGTMIAVVVLVWAGAGPLSWVAASAVGGNWFATAAALGVSLWLFASVAGSAVAAAAAAWSGTVFWRAAGRGVRYAPRVGLLSVAACILIAAAGAVSAVVLPLAPVGVVAAVAWQRGKRGRIVRVGVRLLPFALTVRCVVRTLPAVGALVVGRNSAYTSLMWSWRASGPQFWRVVRVGLPAALVGMACGVVGIWLSGAVAGTREEPSASRIVTSVAIF